MATHDDARLVTENTVRIKQCVLSLGFDTVGICDLSPTPHADELRLWLRKGMSGTMGYMGRQAGRRTEPERILPGADRAVVVTKNYYQPDPEPHTTPSGLIAKYARGDDYHATIGSRLTGVVDAVKELGGPEVLVRALVDAGPVPERELAQRAGLGWIGKNTMLIDPARGSFFFLASVLTNLPLAVDASFQADRCGSCSRCIEACPTDAIMPERTIDARRCISYLTIEARKDPPVELAQRTGDLIFGCDICQDVCPWNEKFASQAPPDWLNGAPQPARIDPHQFEQMNASTFRSLFGNTPLERPGLDGMRRNARTVVNNLGKDSQ